MFWGHLDELAPLFLTAVQPCFRLCCFLVVLSSDWVAAGVIITVVQQFLSCPKCHCLYPYNPRDSPDSSIWPAILHCNYQKTPQRLQCNALLWKLWDIGDKWQKYVPCSKYLHQDLKFWLGHLLLWEQIESHLDQVLQSLQWDWDTDIHDIWQSQVFHSLKDVYSNAFFPPPAGEGQIVFSLSLDGFNPYSNKIAGMHVKSTGIWLVVLNLPPHLHYLHENVCHLGTILGSPSADQINHYLKLVVDILLEFCDPGVFFSWTSNYPSGRLFWAMLIPFVADMLRAHQLIGLPGVTMVHHFCSVCDLDYHDIDVLDSTEWPEKNANHICYFTGLWKDVESKQHQEIFEVCGLQWSALLDLPYWDPLCYTVIGSMHVLDLGLFCTHCLKIFQISSKQLGGDGTIMKPSLVKLKQVPSQKQLSQCLEVICINEMKMVLKLLSFDCEVLVTICKDYDIWAAGNTLVVGTKWVLAQNIYHWVCAFALFAVLCEAKSSCCPSNKEIIPVSNPCLHFPCLNITVWIPSHQFLIMTRTLSESLMTLKRPSDSLPLQA